MQTLQAVGVARNSFSQVWPPWALSLWGSVSPRGRQLALLRPGNSSSADTVPKPARQCPHLGPSREGAGGEREAREASSRGTARREVKQTGK